MRYHDITTCDMKNGCGLRVVFWCGHCEHSCKNCQNKSTWSKDSGVIFDEAAKQEIFSELDKEHIQGLTLSGGDPLSKLNRNEMTELAKEVKEKYPNKDIWCYTGYEWNDVKDLEIMNYIDILVDGKYVEELSKPSPKWVGSSNQNIIKVSESLIKNKIIILE